MYIYIYIYISIETYLGVIVSIVEFYTVIPFSDTATVFRELNSRRLEPWDPYVPLLGYFLGSTSSFLFGTTS